MKKQRSISFLCSITIIFFIASESFPFPKIGAANTYDGIGVPIKWGVIVLGGYDYYRDLTYNSIQRIEKIMQGRGVPYDLFQDDQIVDPTDTPELNEYPLQYKNGQLRYQVLLLVCDYEPNDTRSNNQIYIKWAVANGTNIILFNKVVMFIPELLGVAETDINWIWQHKHISVIINKNFSDGIKEYTAGLNITIGASLQWHTVIHKHNGMTLWFNKTWDDDWTLGMVNTTYGKGKVWYIGWSWNDAYRMEDATSKYTIAWSEWNFDFWAHAINFALNNVEQFDVKMLPYKRWKGAWIIRFDGDTYMWRQQWIPPESILNSGWVWDYQFCVLGYGRAAGVNPLLLANGAPQGYYGIPSTKVMHTDVLGVLQSDLVNLKDYKAIIYNSSVNGDYDSLKIDFNENKNFADDDEYKIWENITHPTIQGALYWCSISPNFTQPKEINIGWWQTPMMFENYGVLEKFKELGHKYGLSFSFHGWQHCNIGQSSTGNWLGSYGMWSRSDFDFILNATYIEEKYNACRYWMKEKFNATGYGFEENEVIISHPNDIHPFPVDIVIANLSWVLFTYPGQRNFIGFAKPSPESKYWLSSSRIEYFFTLSNFTIIQEIVQTLYPIISTLHHTLNDEVFKELEPYSFPPYTNSIKPANPREAFHFWLNSKYLLEHVANAYYKSDKIILEYAANSTLKGYVWRFPIEIGGKYFNNFLDNRTIGKIKYIDGEHIYIEFSDGGNERIEVTYGDKPYILQVSKHIENITQTYTSKNLKLQLWNNSGTVNIKVNCTRLKKPSIVKVKGTPINFDYDDLTKLCSFNVTLNGLENVEVIWETAPPDPPSLVSPTPLARHDPSEPVMFSWEFVDPDFGDFQTAYQLQLSQDNEFNSIILDTEKTTASVSHIILNLPDVVGVYYWRVKTWDSRNAEGDWSNHQPIIVDRLLISSKGATVNRTDIGTRVTVYFKVVRELDSSIFNEADGVVYISNTAAVWDEQNNCWKINVTQNSVGEWLYTVSNINDAKYNITTINDITGGQKIIWDQLIVTITPTAAEVTIDAEVNFKVMATYAYNNEPVTEFIAYILRDDGKRFITNSNFSDTSTNPCIHQYTISSIKENTYGLTAFTSNSPYVTWMPKPSSQLILEWIISNALILAILIQTFIVTVFVFIKERRKNKRLKSHPLRSTIRKFNPKLSIISILCNRFWSTFPRRSNITPIKKQRYPT